MIKLNLSIQLNDALKSLVPSSLPLPLVLLGTLIFYPSFFPPLLISTILIYLLWSIPLRIPRALYACPLGPEEKRNYIKHCLFIRILFCILAGLGELLLFRPLPVYTDRPDNLLILASILLPGIISFGLRTTRRTRAAENFYIYWFLLLVGQLMIYYIAVALKVKWTLLWAVFWCVGFLANCLFTAVRIPSVFKELFSYKDIPPAEKKE